MNLLANLFYLFAAAEEAGNGAGTGTGTGTNNNSGIWMIVVMGVLIVAMVVMTIIPNKRRQKEYQKMQTEIRPGTKIMTIGRMIGTVVRVYDNNTLEVDVGTPGAPVVITINREAIGVNLDAQAAAQAAKEAAKAAKSAPAQEEPAQVDAPAAQGEQSEIPQEVSELPVEEKPSKKKEDDSI